jgi:hypothetical protein
MNILLTESGTSGDASGSWHVEASRARHLSV